MGRLRPDVDPQLLEDTHRNLHLFATQVCCVCTQGGAACLWARGRWVVVAGMWWRSEWDKAELLFT